jgi:hypothetical protein
VTEFLEAYFSHTIAPYIQQYLDLWYGQVQSTSFYLGESVPYTSSYLTPEALLKSARLLNISESLADNTTRPRVENMMLSTMYVILLRWNETLAYADSQKVTWPYVSRVANEVLEIQFATYYNESGVTHLNEGGHDLKWLRDQINNSSMS